jgi:endonuclease YncB( thermonuclease family)
MLSGYFVKIKKRFFLMRIKAKFLSNNDGDTFKAIILVSVRLRNVDTFEISSKKAIRQTKEENNLAQIAKIRLNELLSSNDGNIILELKYKDNRGSRWVCDVFVKGEAVRVGEILKRENLLTGKYEDYKGRKKMNINKLKK